MVAQAGLPQALAVADRAGGAGHVIEQPFLVAVRGGIGEVLAEEADDAVEAGARYGCGADAGFDCEGFEVQKRAQAALKG